MNFSRRLMLFGFGAFLGVLLCALLFTGKTNPLTSWLPNNRVLERLSNKKYFRLKLQDNQVKCKFECLGIGSRELAYLIMRGDVLFSESKTKQEPKVYVVYAAPIDTEPFKITFSAEDSISKITDVSLALENKVCDCN
jgi:hypothetical protein